MQEIKILTLRWRNFLSFGNTWNEIDFDNNLATFIYGENLDTGSANGAGKTTIFNALSFVLYNKSISNISLQRLINSTNAIKNTLMEVEVSFTKSGHLYHIHRKRGSEYSILLEEDGLDITPDSVNEIDTLIEHIVGISYDLFSKIVIFSGSATPFLELPVGQQRQHIEELFNITILSEKAVALKKIIQLTESDIKVEEALAKEKQNNIDAQKKRLQQAEQRVLAWEADREKQIEQLTAQIETVKDIDFKTEQLLFDAKQELQAELDAEASHFRAHDRDKKAFNKQLAEKTEELIHLRDNECPYCRQKYQAVEGKIEELENEVEELSFSVSALIETIQNIENRRDKLTAELKDVSDKIQYPDLPSLLKTKNNLDSIKQKIKELDLSDNPHLDALEQLEQEKVDVVDFSKLDELKLMKEHQAFLLKLLTDKNSFIRRKIINKTIPFLNSRLNYYTSELGLNHIVNFDDDMSCSVLEYNRELDFGNLSSGEKKRVNLAMSLAFRDILHHLHARINVLLVDEIDASLCTHGVESVIKVLKKKTKEDNLSTWIIMHRAEAQQRFDRDLVVRKEGGFSSIFYIDHQ